MPSHDGARLNDYQHPLPPGPAAQQQYPEEPVSTLELGSGDGAPQHRELVVERQILQQGLAARLKSRKQDP
jgi:hypothetical protein